MHSRNPSRIPCRNGSRQAGMSLIEVLAAVLVVSFGILGLLALLGKSSQATMAGDDTQRAAMLANELGTTMWLKGSVTLTTDQIAAWNTRVAAPTGLGLPGGAGEVTVNDAHSATIVITWTPPNSPTRNYTTRVVM